MVGEKGAVTPRALVVGVVAAVVVVVGVAAFLLRGNGSDGAAPVRTPTSPSSTSPSATVSPSASPTQSAVVAPVLPDAATKPTLNGATAFVQYFAEVYNYSFESLDASAMKSISAKDCAFCESVVKNVDGIRDSGGRSQGGSLVVKNAVTRPGDIRSGVLVNMLVEQAPGSVLGDQGQTLSTVTPSTDKRIDALVRWEKQGWKLVALDTEVKQ